MEENHQLNLIVKTPVTKGQLLDIKPRYINWTVWLALIQIFAGEEHSQSSTWSSTNSSLTTITIRKGKERKSEREFKYCLVL